MLLYQFDGLVCNHTVSLLFIGAVSSKPTEGPGDFAVGFGIKYQLFVGFISAPRVDCFLP